MAGSTAKDLELRCKPHDIFDAFQVFGREHLEKAISGAGGPARVQLLPTSGAHPE